MKRITILVLTMFLSLVLLSLFTKQKTDNTVHISGHLDGGDFAGDSLEVVFWRDYIWGHAKSGSEKFYVPINTKGEFSIDLHGIDHPGRLLVKNDRYAFFLFTTQLVEPGDVISAKIKIENNQAVCSFTGKGSVKYNLTNKPDYFAHFEKPENLIQQTIASVKNKIRNLDKYKNQLTREAYMIIRADFTGYEYRTVCMNIVYGDSAYRKAWRSGKWNLFIKQLDIEPESAVLVQSIGYTEFLFQKNKVELILGNTTGQYTFENLYLKLRNNYAGIVRDKLLGYLLGNYTEILGFTGIDPLVFTNTLADANALIKTPYLKTMVQNQQRTIGKGAHAFDFSLPDSSGNMIHLHDFKGKFVFLDIWSTNCGGCAIFNKEFEKDIYPQISQNPDIVIISISTDREKKKWLSGISKYSNVKYINLYTGGLGFDHPLLNYYNVNGNPYFLFINKEGDIYSSTIPYLGKPKELLSLFKTALEGS